MACEYNHDFTLNNLLKCGVDCKTFLFAFLLSMTELYNLIKQIYTENKNLAL